MVYVTLEQSLLWFYVDSEMIEAVENIRVKGLNP